VAKSIEQIKELIMVKVREKISGPTLTKISNAVATEIDIMNRERLNLGIDADGKKVAPAMIHSALVGSPERFFGILIEHYVGDFPFWLSPIQISILSVNERVIDYCRMIQAALQKEGFRIRIDDRNESIGKKIREAELSKAPYALIVGDREAAASTVSVRRRKKGDLGVITLENLIKLLRGEAL